MSAEEIEQSYWVECRNDACPLRYAYERVDGTHAPHWHFTGSPDHPAWDVP